MSTEPPPTAASEAVTPALPKNFLRPSLLLLLRESPAHGYELLERLGAVGLASSDPGGLYRTLRALEGEGLVHSAWEASSTGPRRRIYELTRAGMEDLHRQAKSIAATNATLEAFLSRYKEFVALPRARDRAVSSRVE